MALASRDVERMLTNKLDMALDDRGDHRVYRLHVDGAFVLKTKLSRGSASHRTLGDDLVSAMARQLRVTTPFFRELTQCTKSHDDYLQHLQDAGIIR